jgi:hypothetical protein
MSVKDIVQIVGVYILVHGGERFTEMTVDSLIKTLIQNFTFFTRTSRFKTFESWFLQYIVHTKRMIETHGNITFHHLMITNAILALDHMVRYKTWTRNKHVEFTHNDNTQTRTHWVESLEWGKGRPKDRDEDKRSED